MSMMDFMVALSSLISLMTAAATAGRTLLTFWSTVKR